MSTKRKAALVATNANNADTSESPATKRRKQSHTETQSPENIAQVGSDLLSQLRKSRDKQGWEITTHFETLPDEAQIPDYYEQIGLPIALDTLEDKLREHKYESIAAFESDVKRMISNAKSFNHKNSQIYSDAEKIRKLVSNFMVERNPAYQDPNYQAIATPVPPKPEPRTKQETSAKRQVPAEAKVETSTNEAMNGRRPSRNAAQTPSEQDSRPASSTPAVQDTEDDEHDTFAGDTFQKAQSKIIRKLMNLTDEDNRLVAANFIHLPPRSLVDYYRIIKHPVSLKGLQKAVKGAKGQAPATGSTLLRSWDEFEEETNFIWNNAREYNEDDSEIVQMAEQLEEYFVELLDKAKAVVPEPPQPKVKLRVGGKSPEPAKKITLKFGQPKPKAPADTIEAGDAIESQREQSKADDAEQRPVNKTAPPSVQRAPSSSASSTVPNGIKRETSHTGSPAMAPSQPVNSAINSTMAPPAQMNVRPSSGSPHPQNPAPSVAAPVPAFSSSNFDSQWRQNGKGASDALIANLNIISVNDPSIGQRFNLSVPASEKRTQQSLTVTLPYHSKHLRIAPTLSSTLMQRPSKTFVTCNSRRLQPLAQRDLDQVRPVYEQLLTPGLNAIEVEVIAGMPRGAPKIGSGPDIEMEKFTIFAHLQTA